MNRVQSFLLFSLLHTVLFYSFQVLIGNGEWMKQNTVAVPKNVNDQMVEQENLGCTAVLAAINGKEVFSMPEFMI